MSRYVVNPLCLFLAVWSTALALYLGGVLVGTFPSPRPLTVALSLLNIGTFSLGYLTWSFFRDLPPRGSLKCKDSLKSEVLSSKSERGGAASSNSRLNTSNLKPSSCPPLTRERLVRALQIILLVGLVALGIELYRLTALAAHFHTSWSYLVTHPSVLRLRLVQFISTTLFQTSPIVMLLSLTNSIFSIGFVLLGLFLYLDQTRWKYFYLSAFLSISLLIGLLHLSRYEVTANVLYLVFAYCFLHAQDRPRYQVPGPKVSDSRLRSSPLRLMVPLAAVALLFLAIEVLLHKSAAYDQTSPLERFAFQVYWYVASPLAAFNEFLSTFHGVYEWGQNTFFPLYKWLCRFHLASEVEIDIYGNKVYLPYLANVYTYLRNFYADFGILGVALAPYILGWLSAAVQRQARRYVHYLNLYVVLLMFILFSFYNYYLFSTQVYLQILLGFLLLRYEMTCDPEDPDGSLISA